ncbi:MAG: ketopantoate reductase family protein [Candidatus Hydrogenedentota bacterium]
MLVMGAGALGSVVGGLMAKAGHAVTLVGRAAHMDAIARGGLRITGIWGQHHVTGIATRTDASGLRAGEFDVIIISVKSYDTRAAAETIAPLLDDDTLVLSYQNGLGNAEIVAEYVGWPRTIGARAIYGAWIPEPGRVDVTVIASPTAIGTYHEATPTERVHDIVRAMDNAGAPTVYTGDIRKVLWAKVAYNCALNPLSALLDVPYGVVGERSESRAILEAAVRELYDVARAKGIALEPDTAEAYLRHFFAGLLPPTAQHYASMREDFRRKRRTEIDALNGAICRYGAETGVRTPVNDALTRLVKTVEANYLSDRK